MQFIQLSNLHVLWSSFVINQTVFFLHAYVEEAVNLKRYRGLPSPGFVTGNFRMSLCSQAAANHSSSVPLLSANCPGHWLAISVNLWVCPFRATHRGIHIKHFLHAVHAVLNSMDKMLATSGSSGWAIEIHRELLPISTSNHWFRPSC